ncbi:MAG: SDR family oxidoreductase [Psychrobacter sp.]|nr:SDR family oxidoreductase [Psychrobacter sp.]
MQQSHYLIIGGAGGIGRALVEHLIMASSVDGIQMQLFATYHRRTPDRQASNLNWINMDVTNEDSIQAAVADIQSKTTHLNVVINAVGMLQSKDNGPEKSIRQLESEFFIENMTVNALPSLLIAKHVKPLLKAASSQSSTKDSPAIYATISARVGSISDNQVGGWYSYRMSKAALNMGMKTLAIEWSRTLKNACVVVMQPGTVDTELSRPFQGNVPKAKLFTADYSAAQLLEVLSTMTVEQSGSFVDWAGEQIPW